MRARFRLLACLLIGAIICAGVTPCLGQARTLLEARAGFKTTLIKKEAEGWAPDAPPPDLFRLVKYPADLGDMAAYVSPSPKDGKKHPAIIWIVGGFSGSIGDVAWAPATPDNDQSARAFREAGIVMMFPSVRGGNQNPGYHEDAYGEVNDIISAANYLAKLDYVDPARIYLGGHSTGGTLALLVAESTGQFRAVFSFGPVASETSYGKDDMVFDTTNKQEVDFRAPSLWLSFVTTPTFVFEGTDKPSNIVQLNFLQQRSTNPQISFYPLPGQSHFSTLAPTTKLIAQKIVVDTGATTNIKFTADEFAKP